MSIMSSLSINFYLFILNYKNENVEVMFIIFRGLYFSFGTNISKIINNPNQGGPLKFHDTLWRLNIMLIVD